MEQQKPINYQAKFIREFNETHRPPFNDKLFERDDDKIVEALQKVILSCERNKYFILKVDKFTVVDDYGTIMKMLREQESIKSDSKDKSFNKYDYISLRDSEIRLLVVDYYIKIFFPKDEDSPTEKNLRVLIMLPKFVDKYYFRLFGNFYCPKYQIVDGSTYNNATANDRFKKITFKSLFMATRIYQYVVDFDFIRDGARTGLFFHSNIFRKMVPAMKYILARYGLFQTASAFGIPDIFIHSEDPENENWYTLKKHNLYISIPKFVFDNDSAAQSLLYTIHLAIAKDTTAEAVWDRKFWLKSLGESYSNKTVDKGLSVLESLEYIYDIPTKEALRLPEEHKKNIYCVLIWIIREFSNLYQKDNLDMGAKRLRDAAEYIASIYATKISNGMFSFSNEGKNIQIKDIEKRISTFPDYLLKAITKDRLINNRNNVNEMDSFAAIKWSFKGVSGLGETKESSIPKGYKQAHPSHLGRVDLDSSSNNEPGVSGMLCPTTPIFDNYFSDFSEPNTWRDRVRDMLEEYRKVKGMEEVFTLQRAIGIVPDDIQEGIVQETIEIVEERIIPFIVHVDENMADISPCEVPEEKSNDI